MSRNVGNENAAGKTNNNQMKIPSTQTQRLMAFILLWLFWLTLFVMLNRC